MANRHTDQASFSRIGTQYSQDIHSDIIEDDPSLGIFYSENCDKWKPEEVRWLREMFIQDLKPSQIQKDHFPNRSRASVKDEIRIEKKGGWRGVDNDPVHRCDPCRLMDTKCDKARPCDSCKNRDKIMDCTYSGKSNYELFRLFGGLRPKNPSQYQKLQSQLIANKTLSDPY